MSSPPRGLSRQAKWAVFLLLWLDMWQSQHMGTLKLHRQTDGPRYYLDGEPVHAGDILEAMTPNGCWQTVRFECFWDRRENTVNASLLLGPDGHDTLPIDTPCRWPSEHMPRF